METSFPLWRKWYVINLVFFLFDNFSFLFGSEINSLLDND